VQVRDQTSNASVAVTAVDVTLTADQARCRHLTTSGVLTANRNVIVPNNWEGIVFCNNTGAFTTTFKNSGGGRDRGGPDEAGDPLCQRHRCRSRDAG
jgi:hypothetical protein